MTFVVEMVLEWLGVGSFVAVAVLIEHLLSASRFPERARWWLIPALIIAWPWPVWVWYATHNIQTTQRGQAHSIGPVTIVIAGALGVGRVCGSNLYTLVHPKDLELTDKAAIVAMIERIISAESNGNPNTKEEHLNQTGVELDLASPVRSGREVGQNGNPRTASGPGTNR